MKQIKLNKEEYNKVMSVAHQVKASTKGNMSAKEFIKMYKAMKTITVDTCAVDELVWGDYNAYEFFENTTNEELFELNRRLNKAVSFIEYWTWEWQELYNNLTCLTSQAQCWNEKYFEQFTTLD